MTHSGSEEKYRTIVEQFSEGLVLVDERGKVCDWNRAHEEISGLPRSEILGHPFWEVLMRFAPTEHRTPEQLERVKQATLDMLRTEQSPYLNRRIEAKIIRPDGTPRYISQAVFRVKTTAGTWIGSMVSDITERRLMAELVQAQNQQLQAQNEQLAAQAAELQIAEANLRQLNAELERRVAERTAALDAARTELQAVNDELSQANRAQAHAGRMKDEFLASMSHELRTPLTAILGLTEALLMDIYEPVSASQRPPIRNIHTSGEHLLALINDILDLSKVEAGRLELQVGPVSVNEVCQSSLWLIREMALKKNLEIAYTPTLDVPHLQADQRRLKQMLVNLLSNAVKFTPEGGHVGLEVQGDVAAHRLHFIVWDTGVGIAPEKQALLFQPFVQLHNSAAREHLGTGLGLALTRRLAELHGGDVQLESAGMGQGSRFIFTLPWQPVPEEAQPVPAPPRAEFSLQTRARRAPVILIADDDPMTATMLGDVLKGRGAQVDIASNGQEVLAQANLARPDAIVMDIQMPEMDGLATLRQLRATEGDLAGTPVIALTALAMVGDRERCLAAGADAYLSKPVKVQELLQVLARLLAQGSAPDKV